MQCKLVTTIKTLNIKKFNYEKPWYNTKPVYKYMKPLLFVNLALRCQWYDSIMRENKFWFKLITLFFAVLQYQGFAEQAVKELQIPGMPK